MLHERVVMRLAWVFWFSDKAAFIPYVKKKEEGEIWLRGHLIF
jgi:uncharacterized protein YaeQ